MSQTPQTSRVSAVDLGLTVEQLRIAKDAGRLEGKRLTYDCIGRICYVSVSRVKAFFRGESVYRDNAIAILKVLGIELPDVPEPHPNGLDWQQVCRAMLAEQRSLTTNLLTSRYGIALQREPVYVPLGLVERRKVERLQEPRDPESGRAGRRNNSRGLTREEVTQKYKNDEFFQQVLRENKSPKSKGRRLAIIGEPGAGKTTLLQAIADWVSAETNDVAIWVSLADLRGQDLEDYLLHVWLKRALKVPRVEPEQEQELADLFNQGRVWLLLDGADEMAAAGALRTVRDWLQGWLAEARIVLTCRVNVWDGGKNFLQEFDVYRNLEFAPEQVEEFINNWFTATATAEAGKELISALWEPGKERVRELVRNPLQLTLLCWFWQRWGGALPETKAGLYERFVEAFYDWKNEYFPTKAAQRRELNQALGKLAKAAIEGVDSQFRLTKQQVCEALGDLDVGLGKLAIDLGWLNQLGVINKTDEPVYAFFHASFLEYFAACVIDNWQFFLKHVPEDPMRGTYRVFDAKWQNVIYFWVGIPENLSGADKLINGLLEFKDLSTSCLVSNAGIYGDRAKKLAVYCLAEHPSASLSERNLCKLRKFANSVTPFKRHEEGGLILEGFSIDFIGKDRDDGVAKFMNIIANFAIDKESEAFDAIENLLYAFCIDSGIDRTFPGKSTQFDKDYCCSSDFEFAWFVYEMYCLIHSKLPELTVSIPGIEQQTSDVGKLTKLFSPASSSSHQDHIGTHFASFRVSLSEIEIASDFPVNRDLFPDFYEKHGESWLTYTRYRDFKGEVYAELEKRDDSSNTFDELFRRLEQSQDDRTANSIVQEITSGVKRLFDVEIEIEDFNKIPELCSEYEKKLSENIDWLLECKPAHSLQCPKQTLEKLKDKLISARDTEGLLVLFEQAKKQGWDIGTLPESFIQELEEGLNPYEEFDEIETAILGLLEKTKGFKYTTEVAITRIFFNPQLLHELESSNFGFFSPNLADFARNPKNWSQDELAKHAHLSLDDLVIIPGNYNKFTYRKLLEYRIKLKSCGGLDPEGIEENIQILEDYIVNIVRRSLSPESYSRCFSLLNRLLDKEQSLRAVRKIMLCWILETNSYFLDKEIYGDKSSDNKNQSRSLEQQEWERLLNRIWGCDSTESSSKYIIGLLAEIIPDTLFNKISDSGNTLSPHEAVVLKALMCRVLAESYLFLFQQSDAYNILRHWTEGMGYQEFYQAWKAAEPAVHPEMADSVPVGNTPAAEALNRQFADLASQLQPTTTHQPILIDLATLTDETDPSQIAKAFSNQIFSQLQRPIPAVSDILDLQRKLLNRQYDTPPPRKLALILQGDPSPALLRCCQQLGDSVAIAWLTTQPADTFRTIPPAPDPLPALQAWLTELG